jgi:hypothetical protein
MQRWRLAGAATYTITLRGGDCMRCLHGQVWVTRESTDRNEAMRDVVLNAGERLCAETAITCFVSALGRRPACVAVNAEAPAGQSPGAAAKLFQEECPT